MSSNIFGQFSETVQSVTVNSTQAILGKKRFLNDGNEFAGVFLDPTIVANNQSITSLELSYLNGLTGNIQEQFDNFNPVPPTLQAVLDEGNSAVDSTMSLSAANSSVTFSASAINFANTSTSETASITEATVTVENPDLDLHTVIVPNSITLNSGSVAVSGANLSGGSISVYSSSGSNNTALYAGNITANSGSKVFQIDAVNNQVVLDDGTNTNTISPAGYTLQNHGANQTHYLTFSETSASGVGPIRKNISLSCNPNTGTITASTFAGKATSVDLVATNASASFYPILGGATSGSSLCYVDSGSGPFTYNPGTGEITATGLVGYSTKGFCTDVSNNATYYPVFSNGVGSQSFNINALVGTPLTYNPSTSVLTAGAFSGSINIADDNSDATYYPVIVSGTGSQALKVDSTTGPFSINPSSGLISIAGGSYRISNAQVEIGSGGATATGASTIAIGQSAKALGIACVSLGNASGNLTTTDYNVSIGMNSGEQFANGSHVCVGYAAGRFNAGLYSVQIGRAAGAGVSGGAGTGQGAVCIGYNAGSKGCGTNSIVIGNQAGFGTTSIPGNNAIAIGANAGGASQVANSICLNASGSTTNPTNAGFYVRPVRAVGAGGGLNYVAYDFNTFEMTYVTATVPAAAVVTTGTPVVLSAPLSYLYLVDAPSTTRTIQLPVPTSTYAGQTVTFRRITTTTYAYNITTVGASNSVLRAYNSVSTVITVIIGATEISSTWICDGTNWYEINRQ